MATTIRAGPMVQAISMPRWPWICLGGGRFGFSRNLITMYASTDHTPAKMTMVHQKMLT